jgi:hypothetical protein
MTAAFANLLWPRGASSRRMIPGRSHPEALGSPASYVVRPGHRLLWPHPSHSSPSRGLFASPVRHCGGEWVPNLSCLSVRACHLQDPADGSGACDCCFPDTQWSSSYLQRLDIRVPRQMVRAWLRNEVVLSSLALRPARLLALHHQGRLLPSFRRPGRPESPSVITTRATVNSRDRTYTGKTSSRMGCKQTTRNIERCSSCGLVQLRAHSGWSLLGRREKRG